MRALHSFVVGSLFGAAAVSAAFALAQSETDPVKLSPQYYTVRIDNDRLRVVEYRLGPGAEGAEALASAGDRLLPERRKDENRNVSRQSGGDPRLPCGRSRLA